MPHVSDLHWTPHDRHDPMLVAALAADDLVGTDRDQALALTRGCAECATLRDDLVALARATASVPPPIATRPRDFQLTPADAARLRPTGWRRLVATLSSPRTVFSKPLGVGLVTLGLVGLLVGNVQVQLGSGSSAAAPAPGLTGVTSQSGQQAPAASTTNDAASRGAAGASGGYGAALVPITGAASAAPAASAPVAAPIPRSAAPTAAATGLPKEVHTNPLAVSPGGVAPASGAVAGDASTAGNGATGEPLRPLNVLFGGAVVIGIGLLLAVRVRGRRPA
jgi:hypothetical protein